VPEDASWLAFTGRETYMLCACRIRCTGAGAKQKVGSERKRRAWLTRNEVRREWLVVDVTLIRHLLLELVADVILF
jgi:hypothetical protein